MTANIDAFDVITIGRIGVDIYPTTPGSLVDVETFAKYLGGSPTNVAVATSRLGWRSAVISRTGDDPFGTFVHRAMRQYGVDDRFVATVPGGRTPVTFCEMFPPDGFPIYFYRDNAPDLTITAEEIDVAAVETARLFWCTLSGFSMEPSRSATMSALSARMRRHPTVVDLDYRPTFWRPDADVTTIAREALAAATVAVGNLAEVNVAVGTTNPEAAAERLLELGLELAVVKMGPDGVLARSREERVEVAPVPVTIVNGLGAGDAFGGALCDGLLSGAALTTALQRANAAGAIVASRLACSDAMPTSAEIDQLIKEVGRV